MYFTPVAKIGPMALGSFLTVFDPPCHDMLHGVAILVGPWFPGWMDNESPYLQNFRPPILNILFTNFKIFLNKLKFKIGCK